MQSYRQRSFSFRADANALGGFLKEPLAKVIPTVAPVSLPAVGGFAEARAEAFNLDEIIACTRAYTRVSGMQQADGSIAMLTTAVVEGLNLLEVVTAKRIVTQLSITIPEGDNKFKISLAGSGFEGLRLAGRDCRPTLNAALNPALGGPGHPGSLLSWQDIEDAGRSQANNLIKNVRARGNKDADQWAETRYRRMTANPVPGGGYLLCSLVNGFDGEEPTSPSGHIVEIPGFGRIILGELRVSFDSVQLVAIRAELGCPVSGTVGICSGGGGGQGES
jgi:hypothetical protein